MEIEIPQFLLTTRSITPLEDGRLLLVKEGDGTGSFLEIVDDLSWRSLSVFDRHTADISNITILKDPDYGPIILSQDSKLSVYLWNPNDGRLLHDFTYRRPIPSPIGRRWFLSLMIEFDWLLSVIADTWHGQFASRSEISLQSNSVKQAFLFNSDDMFPLPDKQDNFIVRQGDSGLLCSREGITFIGKDVLDLESENATPLINYRRTLAKHQKVGETNNGFVSIKYKNNSVHRWYTNGSPRFLLNLDSKRMVVQDSDRKLLVIHLKDFPQCN